jgi:uncharacterized protein (UPF0332 family)
MIQFDWNNYFELAKKLAQNEEEASWRTSISRAYYALFNVLCKHVKRFQSRTDKHRQLINILKDEYEWHRLNETFGGVAEYDIKHIGFELNELRDLRNFADYSASKIISKSLAIDTCDRVQSIFDIISEAQEES